MKQSTLFDVRETLEILIQGQAGIRGAIKLLWDEIGDIWTHLESIEDHFDD